MFKHYFLNNLILHLSLNGNFVQVKQNNMMVENI